MGRRQSAAPHRSPPGVAGTRTGRLFRGAGNLVGTHLAHGLGHRRIHALLGFGILAQVADAVQLIAAADVFRGGTDALLQRGMRLDEKTPGHGIGLAIVKDIAESYGGHLAIQAADLGGAQFTVTIPPPGAR